MRFWIWNSAKALSSTHLNGLLKVPRAFSAQLLAEITIARTQLQWKHFQISKAVVSSGIIRELKTQAHCLKVVGSVKYVFSSTNLHSRNFAMLPKVWRLLSGNRMNSDVYEFLMLSKGYHCNHGQQGIYFKAIWSQTESPEGSNLIPQTILRETAANSDCKLCQRNFNQLQIRKINFETRCN